MPNPRETPIFSSFNSQENHKELRDNIANITSRKTFALNILNTSSSTVLDPKYNIVFGDATAGAITITLIATSYWGFDKSPVFYISNVGGVNNVVVAAAAGDTIAGAASINITPGNTYTIISDSANTNWIAW